MSHLLDDAHPRRGFLARLVAGTAALTAAPTLSREAAARTAGPLAQGRWDDSWTRRVTGRYRAVFDIPQVAGGAGVFRAGIWMQGYAEMYGAADTDLTPILVIRHEAVPVFMNHEFWTAYDYQKQLEKELTGFSDKERGVGNPFLRMDFGGQSYGLEALIARGAIVLGCGLAFRGLVAEVMKKDQLDIQVAEEKARSLLVPGVLLQPSGIFAVARAQDLGCSYVWAV